MLKGAQVLAEICDFSSETAWPAWRMGENSSIVRNTRSTGQSHESCKCVLLNVAPHELPTANSQAACRITAISAGFKQRGDAAADPAPPPQ